MYFGQKHVQTKNESNLLCFEVSHALKRYFPFELVKRKQMRNNFY